jgi:tellurite resistance protein TerC
VTVESIATPATWAAFLALLAFLILLDLALLRRAGPISIRKALFWSGAWVAIALAFNVFLATRHGGQAGIGFLTGYLVEKSLSIENIFVFALIFGALRIPSALQQKILPLGIVAAIVLRGLVIAAGTSLFDRFDWLLPVFGAFLVFTGARLFWRRNAPSEAPLLGLVRKVVPSTDRLDGERWITRENGRRVATPALLALLLVGVADAVFAIDSVPAVLAVTRDPFLVFTSNAFAILGLRALYFAVAGMLERFTFLKAGLSAVLCYVGLKMIAADLFHVPPILSLGVVCGILAAAVLLSLRHDSRRSGGRAAA